MGPLAHGYDIITAGPMMIIWAGLFFIITVVILFLMIVWLILKGIPFLSFLANQSPFKELTPIFKAILNRVPFKPVFNRYSRELTSILQDAMKKYRKRSFENFTNKKVIENFSSKKEYIEDDFYNEITNYYKMKDNYYVGAYKSYKHSDEASLYKTYKIITPDMDDNEVSGVISENNTVAGKISSQSMISKKFKI
jgi:ABC-type multidrug transport system fused ATPase/permease subunit